MTAPKTFDPKCYDLASAFLEDEPHLFDDDRATRLARLIQATVEDFIAGENDSYEPPDTSVWRDAETPFAANH